VTTPGGVRAILLAGGEGRRMGRLGAGRLKPLIPFGSTSRLIDFSLAHARRSGLEDVLLLSQYEERQLMDDLHSVWNREPGFRVRFGPYDEAYRAVPPGRGPVELPARTWPRERGTADALLSKARYVFGGQPSEILILHADHVYGYDYRPMLREHRDSGAALTVAYQRIERRFVHLFGMVAFDGAGALTTFVEKPENPDGDLVFAAFCVFDAQVLHRYLELLDGTDWQHDISRDVIPAMLAGGENIRGHLVSGHWEDIGTVDRYHRAHLALLDPAPSLGLGELPRTVLPHIERRLVTEAAGISRSIVPDDLVNEGRIEHSVVFPGARIGSGATVRDSVLLPGARVPDGAYVESAIVLEDGFVQPAGEAPPPAAGTRTSGAGPSVSRDAAPDPFSPSRVVPL
jgi:glucose-1-phosphate adenylyltransferase